MQSKIINNTITFSELLSDILNGKDVEFNNIKPYLSLDSKDQRAKVNLALAEAYYNSSHKDALIRSKTFIKRAWLLSNFSAEVLPYLEKIFSADKYYDGIREAYKRIGLKTISENNFNEALNYFNIFQSTYGKYLGIDKYDYDFDVLDAVHKMADVFRYKNHIKVDKTEISGKIKIAYLIWGFGAVNSILVKILLYFAKHHDKSLFEVKYFVPETKRQVESNENSLKYLKQFEECGYNIELAPEIDDRFKRSIEITKNINEFGPHILVGNAILTDFYDYFVSALKPAPINIGLLAGPLPLYDSPYMDWTIALFKKMRIESLTNSTYIPLEVELPQNIERYSKRELGFTEESILIASAARSAKFQNIEYWKSIIELLQEYHNANYMAIGIEKNWVPFLQELIPNCLDHRILFTGFRADFHKILNSADILLDTYPTGSGVTLMDAMALGKPCVSFEHNQFKMFDQTDSSGSVEFFNISELVVKRGDFKSFKNVISKLISDSEFRTKISYTVQDHIWTNFGHPKRMAQRLENVYRKIIFNKFNADDFFIDSERENIKISNTNVIYEDLDQYHLAENLDCQINEFKLNVLEKNNYENWIVAYEKYGYNSCMGDHTTSFYNNNLAGMGLYELIQSSDSIIEYGPSISIFMKKFIELFPSKKFYLAEYYSGLVEKLKNDFQKYENVDVLLNYPEITDLSDIDLAFSFLLTQSMPKSLWINHLKKVSSILMEKGSYIFQFAYSKDKIATDSVVDAVNGNNSYQPEDIFKILEEAGYSGADLSVPIPLNNFNSDIVWYICRAYK